jgi:hypothetical protein
MQLSPMHIWGRQVVLSRSHAPCVHPAAPELELDALPLEELEALLLTVADADEPPVLLDTSVLVDPPVLVDPAPLLLEPPVLEVPVPLLDELVPLLVEFVELLVLPPQPAMFAAAIVEAALIASSNSTRRLRMIRPPRRRMRKAPALQTDNIVRSR